ncbi:hypothetical protein M404DRAFT_20745 [Pisolithus tinctorius Marx 270]|uniref:Uncharacterized protein n=1 Tax=Pisolithus tinctorius Marx 270 TaxID=870435 RepID=A0A0C3PQK7_PISTI|nr:hypothetical protein M404DRAFT_20745 [Pisolithus tinctorius Marx 270]
MPTSLENPFMTPQLTGTTFLSHLSPVIATPLPHPPPPAFLSQTPRPSSHNGRYQPLLPGLSSHVHTKVSRKQQGKGKGKDEEIPYHDTCGGNPTAGPANAPHTPDVRPKPITSRNAALDLLASVALARDDEPRLPIAASDYLDIVRSLDIFHDRDNIDGCTPEQVKHFGLLSEIYRAADVIGRATNKIRTTQLSGNAPLAGVIMVSMLEKSYSDILEAVTGGAYHHLQEQQVREFLAPTTSWLLNWIRPKDGPVIPEVKASADQEVRFDPPLEFIDNTTVFKEVGCHLGMAANGSAWEALLQNAMWSGLNKNYHNAIYSTDALPAVPFIPIPESELRYYLGGRTPVPEGHPFYPHACYQCCYLGHWSCHNGQGSCWTPATAPSPPPPSLSPVASRTWSRRLATPTPSCSHHSSSRV